MFMNELSLYKAKEDLNGFNEIYLDDPFNGIKKEKELLKLNKEFILKFNIDFVKNEMSLKDYCIGGSDNANFCYIIERKLRGLGSILGATSKKFGVYWSKEEKRYIPTLKFGDSPETALKSVKNEIGKIIEAAHNNDLNALCGLSLCYMLKYKVYYLYNHKNELPIFSENHLDKILDYFDIDFVKDEYEEANKRKALLDFKNTDPDFSKMTNRQFMCFLYDQRSGLDLKDEKIIKDNETNDLPDFVEVKKLKGRAGQEKPRESKGKTNYDDVAARKTYIGEAGEKLALKFEKAKHPQYKNKIRKVSDDRLGFDIISFDDSGNKIFIEVKTKKHGSANNVDFYLTFNELEKLRTLENYFIYYVCGIKTKKKTIYWINKDVLEEELLNPILYRVKAIAM